LTADNLHTTRLQNWLDPVNTSTEIAGLRFIRNTTINSNTSSSGDIVKFENVLIQSGANIVIEINEKFEAIGTFDAPVGSTLDIRP
jgi:hypothetical protein